VKCDRVSHFYAGYCTTETLRRATQMQPNLKGRNNNRENAKCASGDSKCASRVAKCASGDLTSCDSKCASCDANQGLIMPQKLPGDIQSINDSAAGK